MVKTLIESLDINAIHMFENLLKHTFTRDSNNRYDNQD